MCPRTPLSRPPRLVKPGVVRQTRTHKTKTKQTGRDERQHCPPDAPRGGQRRRRTHSRARARAEFSQISCLCQDEGCVGGAMPARRALAGCRRGARTPQDHTPRPTQPAASCARWPCRAPLGPAARRWRQADSHVSRAVYVHGASRRARSAAARPATEQPGACPPAHAHARTHRAPLLVLTRLSPPPPRAENHPPNHEAHEADVCGGRPGRPVPVNFYISGESQDAVENSPMLEVCCLAGARSGGSAEAQGHHLPRLRSSPVLGAVGAAFSDRAAGRHGGSLEAQATAR